MGLSREEYISLGQSVPSAHLIEWTRDLISLGRRTAGRLKNRGVQQPYFDEIETLASSIKELTSRIKDEPLPETQAVSQTFQEVLDYWREVRLIAKTEFGADPDTLAQFRTGVRFGSSLGQAIAEFERFMPLLREYRPQIGWLGVDDEFLRRGEALLGLLRDAQVKLEAVRSRLSRDAVELNLKKGMLYDLDRKLVRIGRLEFRNEVELHEAFNYDAIRRGKPAGAFTRVRPEKSVLVKP